MTVIIESTEPWKVSLIFESKLANLTTTFIICKLYPENSFFPHAATRLQQRAISTSGEKQKYTHGAMIKTICTESVWSIFILCQNEDVKRQKIFTTPWPLWTPPIFASKGSTFQKRQCPVSSRDLTAFYCLRWHIDSWYARPAASMEICLVFTLKPFMNLSVGQLFNCAPYSVDCLQYRRSQRLPKRTERLWGSYTFIEMSFYHWKRPKKHRVRMAKGHFRDDIWCFCDLWGLFLTERWNRLWFAENNIKTLRTCAFWNIRHFQGKKKIENIMIFKVL